MELDYPLTSLYGLVLQFGEACYEAGKKTDGGAKIAPQSDRAKIVFLKQKIRNKIESMEGENSQ